MTFLTIAQGVARNAGIKVPQTMESSGEDQVKLRQFVNEAGLEISRRVDWRNLRKTKLVTGTGSNDAHQLDDDFARFSEGLSVSFDGWPVRGSLTDDEWLSLPSTPGSPRYFYLSGTSISFYPHMHSEKSAQVQYVSRNWARQGANASTSMVSNGDTAVIPEQLIETGAVWRWRRHVGKPYSDHLAEFEAMLVDLARFDGGVRQP